MLENEKWQKAKEIFQTAMNLPSAERQAFIENATNDDRIKAEVKTLLEAHEEAGDFINESAFSVADFVDKSPKKSLVGKEIGAYKILKEIGHGGMGAVYLAERADTEFTKQVAVKLIKRGLDSDEIIKRFRNERQILANLEHPNIARLLDGGTTEDGSPFLVMEFIEGEPLTRFCDEKDLTLNERLELFIQICSAVQYAHRNLIVHRDLKPSNILVAEDGTPKLLDFGIAKLTTPIPDQTNGQTATNFNVMTPEYASPEQVRGETVTTATDVYSLGIVLYEILTGNRPFSFENKSLESILHTICESEPQKPSSVFSTKSKVQSPKSKYKNPQSAIRNPQLLKGDLDNIVLMAMRKEPERRYSSVEQFAEDIRRYLDGLPIIAREDSFSYRAGKFVSRNKVGVAAVSGVAVSLIAGIFTTTRQAKIAQKQRDKATKINKFLQKMLSSADPRAVGKDAKVVEVLQIAADSIEKDFATSPEIVADLQTTIGLTFLSIGQIDSAEPHLTQALKIRKRLFGLENSETAVSLNNFGKLQQAKGDLKQAEKLFRQSLMILQSVPKSDSLEITSVLGNLGYLLMLEAEYEESKFVLHEKLEIVRRNSGENNSEIAQTLSNLANVYSVSGDKKTAEKMHRKALHLTQKVYGKEHPDTATAMLHLAITIMDSKPDEAEYLIKQTLTSRRKFFGNGHTETAWAIYYFGDIFLRKGIYAKAAECANEILSWRGNSIPETHSAINSTLLMLGRCYLGLKRPTEAKSLLQECMELRKKTLPPDHWLIATAEGYLGECLLQLNKFDEASKLFQKSYKTLLEKLGNDHEHTKLARKRLQTI